MITSIVSRDDSVYKAVPDLAMCDDGSLVCIYRESLFHLFHPFSRIALQTSRDGGLNWGPKFIVDECPDYEKDGGLNNPRILHLGEGRLILICDWIPPFEPENSPNTEILIWRSEDRGETWSTREKTGIKGHISRACSKQAREQSSLAVTTIAFRSPGKYGPLMPSSPLTMDRHGRRPARWRHPTRCG